jgi:hypothetical protein
MAAGSTRMVLLMNTILASRPAITGSTAVYCTVCEHVRVHGQ